MRQIIKKPVISEKSFQKASLKKFTFIVDKKSSKEEIAEMIEKLYSVKILKINSMNIKGKVKRVGKKIGKRDDQKKVIVTTGPKDSISLFEIEEEDRKSVV